MGGEDWELWMDALAQAGVLAPGARTVAYSYIGPDLTYPIYTNGTIGRAKEHLEQSAARLNQRFGSGTAVISVNKALVTQASSAIPVVPLYISLLYKEMKRQGLHEGCIEQIQRLFADHLAPAPPPHWTPRAASGSMTGKCVPKSRPPSKKLGRGVHRKSPERRPISTATRASSSASLASGSPGWITRPKPIRSAPVLRAVEVLAKARLASAAAKTSRIP